jgi:putative ABC transport system permease protein
MRWNWLDTLRRDLRFTWRLALRQRWQVVAAIVSIAIGVGANTAVTSVVDAVLLTRWASEARTGL